MKLASNITLAAALALGAANASAEGPLEGNEALNFKSTLTRAQVLAEAIEANNNGRVVRGEFIPNQVRVVSSLTRAQVKAEAAEARRLGLDAHGDRNLEPTAEQLELIRLAGLRAVQDANVARAGEAAEKSE
jgi:hypothetical protein